MAYSKSLETRNPPVAKFLSRITLEPAVVNQWILEIGRDKKDPRAVAGIATPAPFGHTGGRTRFRRYRE